MGLCAHGGANVVDPGRVVGDVGDAHEVERLARRGQRRTQQRLPRVGVERIATRAAVVGAGDDADDALQIYFL